MRTGLKITVFLAILGGLGAAAAKLISDAAGRLKEITGTDYTYGEASVQDLAEYVNVSGTVASTDSVSVTSQISEKIAKLYVKAGDSVREGDLLCEFDTAEIQRQIDALNDMAKMSQNASDYHDRIRERTLQDAKSTKSDVLRRAQSAIDMALSSQKSGYDRYNEACEQYNEAIANADAAETEGERRMYELEAEGLDQMIDQLGAQLPALDAAVNSAYDAYREAEKNADLQIRSAQDAIDAEQYSIADSSTESQLEALNEQLEQCRVTAPADGVITQLNIAEGSISVSGELMRIEDTESLVVRGVVGEYDVLSIEEGMACEIKPAANTDTISGKVRRIEHFVSGSVGDLAGYSVEISIDDEKAKLLIGMNATAKIILDKRDQVLSVPYDALMGGENDGYSVYKLTPLPDDDTQCKVTVVPVKIGFEGDSYTEITEGDILPGDTVLTYRSAEKLMPNDGDIIPNPKLNS